jgi:LPS-assembly lipoprotein
MKGFSRARVWLPLLLAVLLLDGCGFHLRGAVSLPLGMEKVYVKAEKPNTELLRELKKRLRFSGASIVGPEEATSVLEVFREEADRNILTLEYTTGQISEFQLEYQVEFEVRTRGGKTLVSRKVVSATRNYTYNRNNVLSMSSEERSLLESMREEVVDDMMRYMQMWARVWDRRAREAQ